MSVHNIFKSTKVRRLEKEVAELKSDIAGQFEFLTERMETGKRLAERNVELRASLDEITEARDTLQAVIAELKDNRDYHFRRLGESMETTRRVYQRLYEAQSELADMTEARDAVAAGAKYLRDRCDMQDAVLKLVATYGEKHPECVVRIAKAVVEGE